MPKIGTLCYAIDRGLGHLAKAFYDHGVVTDVMVVEHASIPTQRDWYPNAQYVPIRWLGHRVGEIREFLSGLDVFLAFETPFTWDLLHPNYFQGHERPKLAIIPMKECYPERYAEAPWDLMLCPSMWEYDYFRDKQRNCKFLPVPADPAKTPWRQREKALHYVHNGGYLGLRGREGTRELITTMQYVKSPLKLTVRCQEDPGKEWRNLAAQDSRIEFTLGTIPYDRLFAEGDVYVAPQKFNGLSLPLQEAYASGMLVMTTDRFPMNTWLPRGPMIQPKEMLRGVRVGPPYCPYDECILDPREIAQVIDAWYGEGIADYSRAGREWAERNSWEQLKPEYLVALEGIL
jgi:hypothetical protein